MARDDITDDPVVKQELRDLDGIIPEKTDRRRFLGSAMATMLGMGVAGCAGNGGDGNNGSPTDTQGGTTTQQGGGSGDGESPSPSDQTVELDRNSVIFRNTWHAEPDYSTAFAADLQGHWNDQNIRPVPNAVKGFGSGDTAKRVGTGQEMLGQGGIDPVIGGIIEGYKITITGGAKTRNALALMYREDSLESPMDLAGKTILVESAYEQHTMSLMLEAADVSESEVNIQTSDPSAAYSLLARGDADAIWGTMGNIPPAEAALQDADTSLGAEPLYNHMPVYGYVTYAHKPFYENNTEYVQRVAAGYSHAMGWVILNPRKAVEFMRQDVNQALQTQNIETQMNIIRVALIATNLTAEAKEVGLTALETDKLQTTFDQFTQALDLGDNAPDVGPSYAAELKNEADLRKFSNDEWNQAVENGGKYVDLFETG